MDDSTPTERSPRSVFRARLAAFAEEHPDLDVRAAATRFGNLLMREEPDLVDQFLSAEAQNILTWELRAQFSQTRRGIFAALDFSNPDRPALENLPEERKESLYEKITQWREFVPSENRVRLLMTFTKRQLLDSSQYDAARAFQFGWKQVLKERIAAGLPDETTTVAEHYTPDQLAVMGEAVRKEMTRGNFRLKIQPVRSLPRSSSVQEQTDGRNPKRSKVDRRLAAS